MTGGVGDCSPALPVGDEPGEGGLGGGGGEERRDRTCDDVIRDIRIAFALHLGIAPVSPLVTCQLQGGPYGLQNPVQEGGVFRHLPRIYRRAMAHLQAFPEELLR